MPPGVGLAGLTLLGTSAQRTAGTGVVPLTCGAYVLGLKHPVAPLSCLAIPALPMQARPSQNRFPCRRRQRRSRQPLLPLGSYWALIAKAFSRLPPAQ